MLLPTEGLVYDYLVDDGGIFDEPNEEEEEEKTVRSISWKNWMSDFPPLVLNNETKFSDIIVPTIDNVRSSFLVELLLKNDKPSLCIGPTGTGKTLTISDKLTRSMPKDFSPEFIVFSAKTSSNQTQDLIDSKLDKRLIFLIIYSNSSINYLLKIDVKVFSVRHSANTLYFSLMI